MPFKLALTFAWSRRFAIRKVASSFLGTPPPLSLQVIHTEGVIHNDLKPENFVCIGARLKLIDFGIANRIEAEKTSIERDMRCGTINYMAPETIEANDVSDRFKVNLV